MKTAVISFLAEKIKPCVTDFLTENNIECRYYKNFPVDSKSDIEYIKNTDFLLIDPFRGKNAFPFLEKTVWIQSAWAGVEEIINYDKIKNHEITLTRIKNTFAELISEYVMGYIIATHRSFFKHYENQKMKKWKYSYYSRLADKTVGLIGCGTIGSEIARKCFAFGINTIAFTRTGQEIPAVTKVYKKNRLVEFLKKSDFLVSTLPYTPETNGIVNKNWFKNMKKNCIFINVGRGKTVVEKELEKALIDKQISGAVLDVFENEPLSENSKLWEMDNVIITPHISGITFPEEISRVWMENIERFLKKEELLNMVNPEIGY